jgi:catecholate siderophore receptor
MRSIDRTKPAFLALSCVGFVSSAYAAEPQDGAAKAPRETELKGVTVTAAPIDDSYSQEPANTPKFVAPLIDTPRSIVIVPAQVIKDVGATTLADALRTVPGITFGAAEGGNPIGDRPFIRGFDAQGSTYLDGVRDLGSQTREVFAVDQIQVIRGSDSVMGGRGSAGGTINIISKLPRAENSVTLEGTLGNADYKRLTLDANYKLSNTIAVRLAAMWHDQDVAGRDAIWQKRWGIAPSITFGLGTSTRFTLSYYHLHTRELPDSGIPYEFVCSATVVCNIPAGHTTTEPAHHVTTVTGETGTVSRDSFFGLKDRDFRMSNSDDVTARLEHDFGDFTLHNSLRWARNVNNFIFTLPDDSTGNVVGNPNNTAAAPGGQVWRRANTRYGTQQGLYEQLELSGKFKTGGIEHSILLGAELSWEKAKRGIYVVNTGATNNSPAGARCTALAVSRFYCADLFNPNPNDPWINYSSDTGGVPTPIVKSAPGTQTRNKAQSQSVYAFDSITLVPSLILNLGGRWERFHSRTANPEVSGVRPILKRTDEAFTYQAGLVFKPSQDSSVYASYATAATPPNSLLGEGREDNGFGTTTQDAVNDLKIQRTRTIEVGAKALAFHDQLSLTVAAFRTDTANARVTGPSGLAEFLGKTRIQGIELGINGNITERWNVFGGYTYLDAKIRDGGFTSTTGRPAGCADAPAPCGLPNVTIIAPSVNTGKRVPQTAAHNVTLNTTYKVTPKLVIGGGMIYSSSVNGGYADDRVVKAGQLVVTRTLTRQVPGYVRFDANASYDITDHIQVRLNVQNLTNKRYFSQTYTSHYATMAPARTVLGTLSVHY